MIILQIEMGEEFGELFAVVLKGIETKLDGDLPRAVELPDDPDMIELWSEELKEQLLEDLHALDRLLSHPDFGKGEVSFEEEEAEKLVRAISASRLGIRRLNLGSISDEELEGSLLPYDEMEESLRISYLCFLFLAGLQETSIQALDPVALDMPEGFIDLFSGEDEVDEDEDESDPDRIE